MSAKTIMQCPACHELGMDDKGEHLVIYPTGHFGCVLHKKDKAHNRRILELRPELPSSREGESVVPPGNRTAKRPKPKIDEKTPFDCAYDYRDADRKLVYQVRRYLPKTFRPYMPSTGKLDLPKSVTRIPYRLPEIIQAQTVWIVEGEKDADNLAALGYAATSRAGGSSAWEPELTQWFAGKDVIFCGDNDKDDPAQPGPKYRAMVEAAVMPVAKSWRSVYVPEPHNDIADYIGTKDEGEAHESVEALLRVPDPLALLLDARRFDLSAPPPIARPIYRIGSSTVCTPGNLTVIAAQAKAGKSALVGAFIAAATGDSGDTLGIGSSNAEGRALIHLDTEQSPADHHGIVATALRRIGAARQPSWLRSYRIADVSMRERFGLLEYELQRARQEHGGIHSALLDGTADLVADPNDSTEAFAAVERLHRLAVTYDTSIVCVLHFNPGSDFNKTRGHLGSQLERKAETNLALEKADGVTVVYTKMARHAHIEKENGARFQWDETAGMHMSCGTVADERQVHDDFTMRAVVDEAFTGRACLRYSELVEAVMRIKGVKDKTAEKTIAKMVPRYVKKSALGYEKV